jgi:hypothetical protein
VNSRDSSQFLRFSSGTSVHPPPCIAVEHGVQTGAPLHRMKAENE